MAVPEPNSFDFDLIPADPGLINPDLALDAALAPVEDIETDAPKPFGRSWSFDFTTGQFVRQGSVPKPVYEVDSLIMWCEHTLRTARLAHPIYQDAYGVDQPFGLIGQANVADEELSVYQEDIEAALLLHDRIVAVENFEFAQDPFEEILEASFTVVLDAAPPLQPQTLEFTNVPVGSES